MLSAGTEGKRDRTKWKRLAAFWDSTGWPNKTIQLWTCIACVLNRFSCVQLCATPWTAAHQAPLSRGDSVGKSTGVECHCLLRIIQLLMVKRSMKYLMVNSPFYSQGLSKACQPVTFSSLSASANPPCLLSRVLKKNPHQELPEVSPLPAPSAKTLWTGALSFMKRAKWGQRQFKGRQNCHSELRGHTPRCQGTVSPLVPQAWAAAQGPWGGPLAYNNRGSAASLAGLENRATSQRPLVLSLKI